MDARSHLPQKNCLYWNVSGASSFRQYAPGLDLEQSTCGVHAVDIGSGKVLGSLIWLYGNQIFALDWLPNRVTCGFPFRVGLKRATRQEKNLFYAFKTETEYSPTVIFYGSRYHHGRYRLRRFKPNPTLTP